MSDPGRNPGPIVIPSCVQATILWTLNNGRTGINVLHASYTGGFTPTTAVANALTTGLTTGAQWTALAVYIVNTGGIQSVQLRDLNQAGLPIVPATVNGALGAAAPPGLAAHTALVVTMRTARAGRNARGRAYVPAWGSEAMGTGGVAFPAAVTALQNWVNTWLTVFSAQGLTLGVANPARLAYTGETGTPHPARTPATIIPATSISVRNGIFDTQRRREGRS